MARTGGLGRPAGQLMWPVRGRTLHGFGEQQQGELRWKRHGDRSPRRQRSESRRRWPRAAPADWLQGYGLMVVVEHGKGDMSVYGWPKRVGQRRAQVRAGQPIALVGTTAAGNAVALFRNPSSGTGG